MKTAAAYVRMSTEHQRYSIQNQVAEIEAYCERNELTIVRLYTDAGISGLTFENRPGLRSLIADAETGELPFDLLVVLDVSRWGRFQNPDEGAYYEHVLRRAGVRMVYCGEPFENDDSPAATIIKSVKRAMAAEFSRELSRKVKAGLRRNALNGYRGGGHPGYGLRRVILSRDGAILHVAKHGERKMLQDGRTVLGLGSKREVSTVRRIFRLYVRDRWRIDQIAKQLNREKIPAHNGGDWNPRQVSRILFNEKYAGTCLFGLTTESLGSRRRATQPENRVGVRNAYPAIVSLRVFNAAQALRRRRRRTWTREEAIQGLTTLFASHGVITRMLLEGSTLVPSLTKTRDLFGSIHMAMIAAGIPVQSNAEKRGLMRAARTADHEGVPAGEDPGAHPDWESVLDQAVAQRLTVSEVAFGLGCSTTAVRRRAKANAITLGAGRSPQPRISWARELANAARLGETACQLSSRLRVKLEDVEWAMARNKISLPGARTA